MAITTLEGLLEIDLADVFAWLSSDHHISEDVKSIRFSVDEDGLVVEMAGSKPLVCIDAPDLWKWVIDKHLPAGLNHFETAFGVPGVDNSNAVLAITFAASNEGDPRSWAKPPACLAEWHLAKAA